VICSHGLKRRQAFLENIKTFVRGLVELLLVGEANIISRIRKFIKVDQTV
jgi:hypothetical protein